MTKSALISTLSRIATNTGSKDLTHHQVMVFSYGILSVIDEVEGLQSLDLDEIKLFLKMMTKPCTPHHAKCLQAEHCISILRAHNEPCWESAGFNEDF